MKQLIGAIVLMFCSLTAYADRIDNMEEEGVKAYCENEQQLVTDGMHSYMHDVKRAILPITDMMRAEAFLAVEEGRAYNFPKDGIFYDPTELNARELLFFTEYVFKGWDIAEAEVADFKKNMPDATGVYLTDGAVARLAKDHFEACLKRRSSEKTTNNTIHKTDVAPSHFCADPMFVKAASSQRLVTPYSANSPQEEHCTDRAVKTYNACMIGK